jgi:hypothetical protein
MTQRHVAGFAVIVFLCPTPLRGAEEAEPPLVVHWVDFGITPLWHRPPSDPSDLLRQQRLLRDKYGAPLHDVCRDSCWLIERMPAFDAGRGESFPRTQVDWSAYSGSVKRRIEGFIRDGLLDGHREFEIRTVQDVNLLGYADPLQTQQDRVREFAYTFAGALAEVRRTLEAEGFPIEIDASLGSNGVMAGAVAIQRLHERGLRPIDAATVYDGRARAGDVERVAEILDGRIILINTAGDAYDSPLAILGEDSIASFDAASRLKDRYVTRFPWLRHFWVDPEGWNLPPAGHLGAMRSDPGIRARIKEDLGGGKSRRLPAMSLREFHALVADAMRSMRRAGQAPGFSGPAGRARAAAPGRRGGPAGDPLDHPTRRHPRPDGGCPPFCGGGPGGGPPGPPPPPPPPPPTLPSPAHGPASAGPTVDAGMARRDAAHVGGVMLRSAVRVERDGEPSVRTTAGFSILVEGRDARARPEDLPQFVTALWAVYLGADGPGVSIDPIAPGADRHQVRYIGAVANTDLARVMRVADYTMKKWAMGEETPGVPGLASVDAIAVRMRATQIGGSRRFWFVPEEMVFRRRGGAAVFDRGRMTLRTELDFPGLRGRQDAADLEFARVFTERYAEIAAAHPVFDELFRYAKLVALARWLKESGTPLLSYLLLNKDLIPIEESARSVQAFRRRSEHLPDVRIEGGVDLSLPPGRIRLEEVLDGTPASAGPAGTQRLGPSGRRGCRPDAYPGVGCGWGEGRVLRETASEEASSAWPGTRGQALQTDLAVRLEGMAGLELMRHYAPDLGTVPSFGRGWHLVVPYRIHADEAERVDLHGLSLPRKIIVENLLRESREALTLNPDRDRVAWVSEEGGPTLHEGLFLLANGSLVLEDKLGNVFTFRGDGLMSGLTLAGSYELRYEYDSMSVPPGAVEQPRLSATGAGVVGVGDVIVPRGLRLRRGARGKDLLFKYDGSEPAGRIQYRSGDGREAPALTVMSDGSFFLADGAGGGTRFGTDGTFLERRRLVVRRLLGPGGGLVFEYEVAGGEPRIFSARFESQDPAAPEVRYHYDAEGRLAAVAGRGRPPSRIDYREGRVFVSEG